MEGSLEFQGDQASLLCIQHFRVSGKLVLHGRAQISFPDSDLDDGDGDVSLRTDFVEILPNGELEWTDPKPNLLPPPWNLRLQPESRFSLSGEGIAHIGILQIRDAEITFSHASEEGEDGIDDDPPHQEEEETALILRVGGESFVGGLAALRSDSDRPREIGKTVFQGLVQGIPGNQNDGDEDGYPPQHQLRVLGSGIAELRYSAQELISETLAISAYRNAQIILAGNDVRLSGMLRLQERAKLLISPGARLRSVNIILSFFLSFILFLHLSFFSFPLAMFFPLYFLLHSCCLINLGFLFFFFFLLQNLLYSFPLHLPTFLSLCSHFLSLFLSLHG